ncbi:hypothetical protein [Nocardiopsis trehalosi]|uniref:hypothetical protein n=1 Tax=Nocardiopsis trehalosi TaxID=109329 RepID=UPI000833DEC3|nr:hypothetical protein [Nocardiopsis trehalosi]
MRLRLTVHRARLAGRDHRVLRPAAPLRRLSLRPAGGWYLLRCTDAAELMRVAALWQMAARSRHSLVHLPLRSAPEPPPEPAGAPPPLPPLDLLLCHHSLGFPASRWKRLRARLGPGRPHTADTGTRMPEEYRRHPQGWVPPPGDRDPLDLSVHADTLVVAGSALAFHRGGAVFLGAAVRGPARVREPGGPGHLTTALHPLDGLIRRPVTPGILVHYFAPG